MLGIDSAYTLIVLGIAVIAAVAVLVFIIMGVREFRKDTRAIAQKGASDMAAALKQEAEKRGDKLIATDFLQGIVGKKFDLSGIVGKAASKAAGEAGSDAEAQEEEEEKKPLGLESYYDQGVRQARVAFWFSMIFAALGFTLVAFSLLSKGDVSYAGSVSGLIIELVAGLFFQQSNKARALMTTFITKLRQDENLRSGLIICEEIRDKVLKDAVRVKLSLHLAGLDDKTNIAGKIIDLIPKRDNQAAQPAGA